MNKLKGTQKRIWSLILAFVLVATSIVGYLPAIEVQAAMGDATPEEIKTLIQTMKDEAPKGQEWLSYTNNYQSMEPEQITYLQGTGSCDLTTTTGKLTAKMGSGTTVAAFDKCPWLSSGYLDIDFQFSDMTNNFGFIYKAVDTEDSGVGIRYDGGTSWVIQLWSTGDASYKVVQGPALEAKKDYNFKMVFHGNRLILAVNDSIFYNEDSEIISELEKGSQQGQLGLYKRNGAGTFTISNIAMEGIGTTEKPSDFITYEQDYEDPEYTPNWNGGSPAVKSNEAGTNKYLEVSGSGRFADLDSVKIAEGTVSLDYNVVSIGGGYAIAFRHNDTSSVFSELGWDKTRWVPESSNGWGDTLDIPAPVEGKWNNIILNFQGKEITVYLNKEYIGVFPFDKFTTEAGKFGLRLKGSKLQIDNVKYTSEILAPEKVIEYNNNYDDGIKGTWSQGESSIVAEGNNKVLKLSGIDTGAILTDGIDLTSGTFTAKVKTAGSVFGFIFASTQENQNVVSYDGEAWQLSLTDGQTYTFNELPAPRANAWNKVGVQFLGNSITVSINGTTQKMDLSTGVILEGSMGFISMEDLYVDDVAYTEKIMEMDTTNSFAKVYYEEYFETIGNTEVWEGMTNAKIAEGCLQGELAAQSSVVNIEENVAVTSNGVYQAKVQATTDKIGMQIGTSKIYHTENGNWIYDNGSSQTAIGTGEAVKANEDVIIRAEIVQGELTLKVNGFFVGKIFVEETFSGSFGIYNADTKAVTVKVDAIGTEEIRTYSEDYSETQADTWTVENGSAAIVDEAAAVTLNGVAKATNTATPKLKDQHITLNLTSNVEAGMAGGRYGILVREDGSETILSVETDINGEWRVNTEKAAVKFPTTFALIKDKTYTLDIDVVGQNVTLAITNDAGETTDLGTVSDDSIPMREGNLGARSWYSGKTLTFDNIVIVEKPNLPVFTLDAKTTTLEKDNMVVTIDENFPRIESYVLNGKTLQAQQTAVNEIVINANAYTPRVTGTKVNDSKYSYVMNFEEINVEMTAVVEIKDNHVVQVSITNIKELGEFLVRTISFGNSALAMVDSSMTNATFAWGKSSGAWEGITEELVDDLKAYEGKSDKNGVTMAMVSGDGLAFSVENNVMSGGNKVLLQKEVKPLVKRITAFSGNFMYRHAKSDVTEELPYMKIVVTEDMNDDQITDWQDGAVAYREYVYNKVIGGDDTANSMMYIPFNFASQANEPFLGQLDTGKILYNYMDGFSQMLLDKGYQAEGHDDDIPSYSNVGVRQGGVDDFNYLINEGAKYNMRVGVHLNATEPHLDANELFYNNFNNATLDATVITKSSDSLLGGWDWIDTGYYYDQTKDVQSGQLEKRFTDLYELTNDHKLDANDPTVDFYYIDVYTGNDYNAQKLLDFAHGLGLAVGTEFAGPLEPGVAFTHWGTDLGYPNKGNGSLLSRIVKNDLDIFVGHALFRGSKIPVVGTWGDSKMDIQQGVEVFFNEIVPTKFMQHYGVLKATTDEVNFEGNVTSKRNKKTGKVELSKDGKLIATWADTGTTTAESERHSSPTDSFVPWIWDHSTYEELGVMDGAKIYHWNTTGTEQTWDVPDYFKTVTSFDLYKTTQYGRELVKTVNVTDGKVVLDTQKNTPYVLYPSTIADSKKVVAATNWGEGSPAIDFQFNSGEFNKAGSWDMSGDAIIETEAGRTEYTIAKEMDVNRWNKQVKFAAQGGTVSQTMTGLESGEDYTVSVWTKTEPGRKSTIKVELGGKTYENHVTGMDGNHQSSFKYRGSTFQRVAVEFHVPEGVTTGKVSLIAEAGTGAVYYDDVKVWKHTSVESDVNNVDYVMYEDFENVNEGFGAFEYGGGSLSDHIATDKSQAKYDDNEVVTPADNTVGPVMTWVLDGQNSLKLSESGVNTHIKTNENSLKLQADTDYYLSFEYTLEDRCDYQVYLYSEKTQKYIPLTVNGTTNDKFNLDIVKNSGHKDGTQKKVEATFTTKGANVDDYYRLYFNIYNVRPIAGAKTIDSTLILDNVAVWTDDNEIPDKKVDKTALRKVMEDTEKLNAADYKAESWSVVEAKLAEAKVVEQDTNATQEQVDNAKNALQKAVEELVPVDVPDKADKTNLKKAIDAAKALDGSKYTPESYAEVTAKLKEAEIVYGSTNPTQAQVDAATTALNNAVKNVKPMEPTKVNKDNLKKAIDAAKALDGSKYTPESYAEVTAKLKAAETVYADEKANQVQVDAATTALNNAVKNVKPIEPAKVNKDNLKKAIDAAKALDGSKYTPESYAEVTAKLKEAETVYADEKANQVQVDAATIALNNAVKNVVPVTKKGWIEDKTGWKYYKNGVAISNKWFQDKDKTWYYMEKNGYMATNWKKLGQTWYYLGKNGKMVTGWKQISKVWYFFNNSGKMLTGWQKLNKVWYYFKSSGAMVTGWYKVGGTWYYANSSGAMVTGWYKVGGTWYYANGSGAMVTGWYKVGGTWYYANSSGKMVTGWQKLNRTWYYLRQNGKMATGWVKVNGIEYFMNSQGAWTGATR